MVWKMKGDVPCMSCMSFTFSLSALKAATWHFSFGSNSNSDTILVIWAATVGENQHSLKVWYIYYSIYVNGDMCMTDLHVIRGKNSKKPDEN